MPLDEHAPGQPVGDGISKYVHIYWCKKWMEIEQNYVKFCKLSQNWSEKMQMKIDKD